MSIEDSCQQGLYEIINKDPHKGIESEYYYEIRNKTNDSRQGFISPPVTTDNGLSVLREIEKKDNEINELLQYKDLCEKRINQLHPGHHLPLTEADLKNGQRLQSYRATTPSLSQQFSKEKEEILLSLRNETFLNEEQRAYIEILKQAIESSLIQHGLEPFLRKNNKALKNKKGLDLIVDITKLKGVKDHREKNLQISQSTSLNTKKELDLFKKKTEDISFMNNELKHALEKEFKGKSEALTQLTQLNNTLYAISNDYNNLEQNNRRLLSDSNAYQLLNVQYKLDLDAKDKQIDSLEETINNLSSIKTQYDALVINHQELDRKYDSMSISNEALKTELEVQLDKVTELSTAIKESNDRYANEKNILLKELQMMKDSKSLIEKEMKKSHSETTHRDSQIKSLKIKEIQLARTQNELKQLTNANNEYKIAMNDKVKALSSQLQEMKSELDKRSKPASTNLKSKSKSRAKVISKEKTLGKSTNNDVNISNQMMMIEAQDDKMDFDINEISQKMLEVSNFNDQLLNEIEAVKDLNNKLRLEVYEWKERYNKETTMKKNEAGSLRNDLDIQTYKVEDTNNAFNGIASDKVFKNTTLIQADEREIRLRNEIKYLRENNDKLHSIITKTEPVQMDDRVDIKLKDTYINTNKREQLPEMNTIIENKNDVYGSQIEQSKPMSFDRNDVQMASNNHQLKQSESMSDNIKNDQKMFNYELDKDRPISLNQNDEKKTVNFLIEQSKPVRYKKKNEQEGSNRQIDQSQPISIYQNRAQIRQVIPANFNKSNTQIEQSNPIDSNPNNDQPALNESLDSIFLMITSSYNRIQDFVRSIKKLVSEDSSLSNRNTQGDPNANREKNSERKLFIEEEYMKTIDWFISMSANEFETLYNEMLAIPTYPIKQLNQNDNKDLYTITRGQPNQTIKATLDISNLSPMVKIKPNATKTASTATKPVQASQSTSLPIPNQATNLEKQIEEIKEEKSKYIRLIQRLKTKFPLKELEKEINDVLDTSLLPMPSLSSIPSNSNTNTNTNTNTSSGIKIIVGMNPPTVEHSFNNTPSNISNTTTQSNKMPMPKYQICNTMQNKRKNKYGDDIRLNKH